MESAPLAVRVAGVVVAGQGLTGIGFAVALVFRLAGGAGGPGNNVLGTAGYFAVLGFGVAFAGLALAAGRRAARTPAVVVQLVLLGVAWYTVSGSGQWLVGLLAAAMSVAVLVLVFIGPSRRWAMGVGDTESGDEAGSRES